MSRQVAPASNGMNASGATADQTPWHERGSPAVRNVILVAPALLFLVGFFLAPLAANGWRSFVPEGQFTLAIYARLLDPYYIEVIIKTLVLSFVVTLICLIVGYPIAYYLVRRAGRWSGLIVFLLVAPLLTSIIMRTFGWRVIFARQGLANNILRDLGLIERPLDLLNGPGSVVIGLVHVLVPFMVLSIASVLQSVNPRLEDSARVLGASPSRTFWLITFPLSLDGVGTGSILVFMLATGSFVTLLLLGGGSMQTLPLLVYQQFVTTRDFGLAAAMSNLMLVIAAIFLYLQLRLVRRKGVKAI